ncbi:hypothetical protein BVY02_01900, partial [bacterium J17]
MDESGKTHYSSNENSDAKAAELPKLERENIDERIAKIKSKTPPSCVNRGGVDCSRGADSDGRVICRDG